MLWSLKRGFTEDILSVTHEKRKQLRPLLLGRRCSSPTTDTQRSLNPTHPNRTKPARSGTPGTRKLCPFHAQKTTREWEPENACSLTWFRMTTCKNLSNCTTTCRCDRNQGVVERAARRTDYSCESGCGFQEFYRALTIGSSCVKKGPIKRERSLHHPEAFEQIFLSLITP